MHDCASKKMITDVTLEKMLIGENTIELYDRTRGYFTKNNKFLFSYTIIEC